MSTKIHHIALTLASLEEKGIFYKELANLIQLKLKTFSQRVWGVGDMSPDLLLYQASNDMKKHKYQYGAPGFHHLAFQVPSQEIVDSVYEWLHKWIPKGAVILDAPKEYPHYAPGYYAVYFTDLDGLKLEVATNPDFQHVGIHHIALTLRNLSVDGNFYNFLSQILKLEFIRFSDRVWGLGGIEPEILLYQASEEYLEVQNYYYAPGFHHIAFEVTSSEIVDNIFQFVEKEKKNKIQILDAPKEYPHYAPGYYAVYFTDPCGMKLEVAYIPNPTD